MSKVKTTLNVKKDLLDDFDILAKEMGFTRSALFTLVLNKEVDENRILIEGIKKKNEREKAKGDIEKLHSNLMEREIW